MMSHNGMSIGDALRIYLRKSPLKPRLDEYRIQEKWEEVMGKTIARYTSSLLLRGGRLIITTNVAPLKQELSYSKEKIKQLLNEAIGEPVVQEVVVQ
ncbi:DUF721 domain-containing protein [Compostibacter hankyongensis]|uniref:DUF721 domain-containing protein n=1 Tax=Compostibacter hankyongensis TaxID=1007089 RepID=A0ABP8FK41_9BACT